jgi:hypothetical protein
MLMRDHQLVEGLGFPGLRAGNKARHWRLRVTQLQFLRHEPDSCGLARHALSSRAFYDYY